MLPPPTYPLLLLSDSFPRQLVPTVGQASERLLVRLRISFSINMVSGGGLAQSVSVRPSSSPTTPPGFKNLPSTSRPSPFAGWCTFVRVPAVSFCGSRRLSIGRLLWRLRSPPSAV